MAIRSIPQQMVISPLTLQVVFHDSPIAYSHSQSPILTARPPKAIFGHYVGQEIFKNSCRRLIILASLHRFQLGHHYHSKHSRNCNCSVCL